MNKEFHIVKVYSRNVISDWIQGIRNILGMELIAYANTIDKGIKECMSSTPQNKKWFKIDVEMTSNNGFIILVYGEMK